MAGSINRVTLLGKLGKDPDVRSTQDGRKIVSFSVATSESWVDKGSGERKEKTQWSNVVIFNEGLASVAERFLRKGSKVLIEGQLQSRKWTDQNGQERYATEIVLQGFDSKLVLLDGKQSDERHGGYDEAKPRASSSASATEYRPEDDSEIPF